MTHTPGPWIYYADVPSTEPNWHIVTTANKLRVLANVNIEPSNAMDEANARLIASAPDLLEALKGAVSAWEKFYPLLPVMEGVEDAEFGEFSNARSAICKALGLQPWDYHKHVATATA